jgi:competence protein ComEA
MKRLSRIAAAAAVAVGVVGLLLPSPAVAAKAAPASKVNINAASAQQLETLPGVGPKVAERIVEYRQKSGAFRSLDELLNVRGIGEKSFAKLQPFVALGDAPKPAAPAAASSTQANPAAR